VPAIVTGGQDSVGLRVPAHELTRAVIAELGSGIAAPSANRFGKINVSGPGQYAAASSRA